MNKKSKFILVVLIFLFVFFPLTVKILDVFNEPDYQYVSPKKTYIVEMFDHNAGAVSSFLTVISIRRNDGTISKLFRKNVLVGEFNPEKVNVEWVAENSILIIHPVAKFDVQLYKWKDIAIEYKVSNIDP